MFNGSYQNSKPSGISVLSLCIPIHVWLYARLQIASRLSHLHVSWTGTDGWSIIRNGSCCGRSPVRHRQEKNASLGNSVVRLMGEHGYNCQLS